MKPKTFINRFTIAIFLTLFIPSTVRIASAQTTATFTNPLVTSRDAADPWMIYKDGYYYFTFTTGSSIQVWKSRTITGVDAGVKAMVWTPPASGPQSRDIWAPELHFFAGKWYIYYAADDGDNAHHRLYVLESVTTDPQGAYTDKGKIYDPNTDRWAIDATVMQKDDGSLYLIWSGWEGFVDKIAQNLYIAPMSNPWTIGGNRALISRPDHNWEGWINEGPEVLKHNGKLFIVYSANGSWTPDYCLGLLMNTTGDVMNPQSWTKSNVPFLARSPGVFGAGHNTFVKSADGTEDWIIYHATDNSTDGWRNRHPRAQKITWNTDDTPNFGYPVAPRQPLAVPSGEAANVAPAKGTGTGLAAEYYDNQDFTNLKFRRIDASINFEWGMIGNSDAPVPSMNANTYSVRWQGTVQPRYSETYTFNTFTDDGVRLWIDNKLVIDNWTNHQPTINNGTMTLTAGRRYSIRMDYFEDTGNAIARLEWSSLSQPLEVVPKSQLYPAGANSISINITSPADATSFAVPARLAINSDASDSSAGNISRVEFYANSIKVGEASAVPYVLNWSIAAPGNYTLTARAINDSGEAAISNSVNINVSMPLATSIPSPPRVQALPLRLIASSATSTMQTVSAGGMTRAYVSLPDANLSSAFTARDADGNWPNTLEGIAVSIDGETANPIAVTRLADTLNDLYAVDFAVPDDASIVDDALMTIKHAASGQSWSDRIQIAKSYPALWSTEGTSTGMALAQNADDLLALSKTHPALADAHMRVALYATGIRSRAAANKLTLHARSGDGRDVVLLIDYAGPEENLPGLDLIILRLPEELAGTGQVSISLDETNTSIVFLPVQ